ncbi:flagellar hook-length control protein FliK [Devosia sp. SL43]|uniref:flagellar hook-length control protein FliK n=1 Tax=Devosia sp. SL43 TaxID=2806348 RepID=UPI001F38BFA0|nr:flagellar hook-length control protein FliK [Devosia sp. SL43]UJW86261.1 flagellar hook-length control protein FliK [Devosia sp. SL43]
MSIPSQLPQIVAAARSGALQALALQAGQMLEGKVIGPAPNGGTQVQIGGQMLNLLLPTLAKAGETLKFEVQGSGAQIKLALRPALPQATATALPAGSPPPVPAQPNNLPVPAAGPAAHPAPQAPATLSQAPTSAGQSTAPAVTIAPQPVPPPVNGQPAIPPALSPQPSVSTVSAAPTAQPATSPAPTGPTHTAVAPSSSQPQAAVTATSATQGPTIAPPPVAATTTAPATASPQSPTLVLPQQPYPTAAPKAVAPVPSPPAVATSTLLAQPTAGAAPIVAAAQPTAPPMAATPQAALAQMVQAALPRQDSVTSLTQALTSIAGKLVLPEPVVRVAQQVLAGRVPIDSDTFDAASLQKAVLRSGIFQEASLAKGGTPLLTPQADMKASLLALRQTLTTWLGQQAPLTPAAQIPPPIRGHVPRARLSDAPPIDPRVAPEEVGKQLLERTEAALSRVRLHQGASLPDPVAKTADWSMDVPVLVGQHQTLLQMQIHRDEHNGSEAAAERGWQMRFAINLPGMGEVGAQVSLRGGNTGVMLWAAERGTSEALEADAAALRDTLAAVGLKPGAVIVRHGEPPAPPPAPSGHFVDAST